MSLPGSPPLVIFLHGLGDSGDGWRHLRQELGLAGPRYSFPDAPIQAVTCNGGMEMTSWMDLDEIPVTLSLRDDVEGLELSKKRIHKLIDEAVAAGTPSSRIVLGGFSQGAAMALLAGYTYSQPLAGVAALSGWPPLAKEFGGAVSGGANAATPAFVGHGTRDEVVLPACGERAASILRDVGVDVAFSTYPVEHGAHPAEMAALSEWVKGVLKL